MNKSSPDIKIFCHSYCLLHAVLIQSMSKCCPHTSWPLFLYPGVVFFLEYSRHFSKHCDSFLTIQLNIDNFKQILGNLTLLQLCPVPTYLSTPFIPNAMISSSAFFKIQLPHSYIMTDQPSTFHNMIFVQTLVNITIPPQFLQTGVDNWCFPNLA